MCVCVRVCVICERVCVRAGWCVLLVVLVGCMMCVSVCVRERGRETEGTSVGACCWSCLSGAYESGVT